jgi:hypothetical protein
MMKRFIAALLALTLGIPVQAASPEGKVAAGAVAGEAVGVLVSAWSLDWVDKHERTTGGLVTATTISVGTFLVATFAGAEIAKNSSSGTDGVNTAKAAGGAILGSAVALIPAGLLYKEYEEYPRSRTMVSAVILLAGGYIGGLTGARSIPLYAVRF